MGKIEAMKLKAQAANCRRIAETSDASMKQALLKQATKLEKQATEAEGRAANE